MKTETSDKLDQLCRLSFTVGCDRDQMARFLYAGYVPQPKQLEFHAAARSADYPDGPSYIGYGGTRGQAKSHAILAQAAVDDMQRLDGLKFLYLRKIQKKASESFDDLRRKVLRGVDHKYTSGVLRLPNDSFMIMGGFRSESEIDSYLGLEYDGIIIEDATTLTETKHNAIMGALRSARTDWRPRVYESANPGGVGHQWFRKLYLHQNGLATVFIHTTMGDNKFINPEYETYLNSLKGWLRRAWRDGDFDISAGQFFDNWDEDKHVVPWHAPDIGMYFWLAMDWGYQHWCIIHLLAKTFDGNILVVDEHAERRWQVPQHSAAIHEMLRRNGLLKTHVRQLVCGHDAFASKDDSGVSIVQKFERDGWRFERANVDRINGAAEMLHLLGGSDANLPQKLFVSDRCHRLIECMPLMEHDPHRPEDVLKIDCDDDTGEGGDDAYDCCRYGVMAMSGGSQLRTGPNPTAGYRG